MTGQTIKGHCLCGAVRFHGVARHNGGIQICHCGQCRRWNSGPFMLMRCDGGITLDNAQSLKWYRASPGAERGFCSQCGSSLFWRRCGAGMDVAVSVGALEDGHGQRIIEHVWAEDQPAYYEFADHAPRLSAAQFLQKYP